MINKIKALEHEKVNKIQEVFKLTGKLLVCSDYSPAGSLKDDLQNGPFPVPKTREYIQQILEGLSYLHGQEIVHCDIKCKHTILNFIYQAGVCLSIASSLCWMGKLFSKTK